MATDIKSGTPQSNPDSPYNYESSGLSVKDFITKMNPANAATTDSDPAIILYTDARKVPVGSSEAIRTPATPEPVVPVSVAEIHNLPPLALDSEAERSQFQALISSPLYQSLISATKSQNLALPPTAEGASLQARYGKTLATDIYRIRQSLNKIKTDFFTSLKIEMANTKSPFYSPTGFNAGNFYNNYITRDFNTCRFMLAIYGKADASTAGVFAFEAKGASATFTVDLTYGAPDTPPRAKERTSATNNAALQKFVDQPFNQFLLKATGTQKMSLPNTDQAQRLVDKHGIALAQDLYSIEQATQKIKADYFTSLKVEMANTNSIFYTAGGFNAGGFYNNFITRDFASCQLLGKMFGQADNATAGIHAFEASGPMGTFTVDITYGAATPLAAERTFITRNRSAEEWKEIYFKAWIPAQPATEGQPATDPLAMIKIMAEKGWDCDDIAHVSGLSAQDIGDHLTRLGAPAGFGGAVTIGRDALNADYLQQLKAQEANAKKDGPGWVMLDKPIVMSDEMLKSQKDRGLTPEQIRQENLRTYYAPYFDPKKFTQWYISQNTAASNAFMRVHLDFASDAPEGGNLMFLSGFAVKAPFEQPALSFIWSKRPKQQAPTPDQKTEGWRSDQWGVLNLSWKNVTKRANMLKLVSRPENHDIWNAFNMQGIALPAVGFERMVQIYGTERSTQMYRLGLISEKRSPEQWAKITAAWQLNLQGDHAGMFMAMVENALDVHDMAQVSGLSVQNIADHLTRIGAPAKFGSEQTLGRKAVNADYVKALTAAQANKNSPFWQPIGKIKSFNTFEFTQWYAGQNTAASKTFMRIHQSFSNEGPAKGIKFGSGMCVSGATYDKRGDVNQAVLSWPSQRIIEGYSAWPMASLPEIMSLANLIQDPLNKELLKVTGTEILALPTTEIGERMRVRFGLEIATDLFRIETAKKKIENYFFDQLNITLAQPCDPSVNGAWTKPYSSTQTVRVDTGQDEDGKLNRGTVIAEGLRQDFHAGVFYNWFIAQDNPQSRMMRKLYGDALPGANQTGFRASGAAGSFSVRMNSSSFVGTYMENSNGEGTKPRLEEFKTAASAVNNVLDSVRLTSEPPVESLYGTRTDGSVMMTDELKAVDIGDQAVMSGLFDLQYVGYVPGTGFVTVGMNIKPPEKNLDAFEKISAEFDRFMTNYGKTAVKIGLCYVFSQVGIPPYVTAAVFDAAIEDDYSNEKFAKNLLQGYLTAGITQGLSEFINIEFGSSVVNGTSTSIVAGSAGALLRDVTAGALGNALTQAAIGGSFKDGLTGGAISALGNAIGQKIQISIDEGIASGAIAKELAFATKQLGYAVSAAIKVLLAGRTADPLSIWANEFLDQLREKTGQDLLGLNAAQQWFSAGVSSALSGLINVYSAPPVNTSPPVDTPNFNDNWQKDEKGWFCLNKDGVWRIGPDGLLHRVEGSPLTEAERENYNEGIPPRLGMKYTDMGWVYPDHLNPTIPPDGLVASLAIIAATANGIPGSASWGAEVWSALRELVAGLAPEAAVALLSRALPVIALLLTPGNAQIQVTQMSPNLRFVQRPGELAGNLEYLDSSDRWVVSRVYVRRDQLTPEQQELFRTPPSPTREPQGPPVLPGAPIPVPTKPEDGGFQVTPPVVPGVEIYPVADQPTMQDLALMKKDSEVLGGNLGATGDAKPEEGYEAHHIVPTRAGGKGMQDVRDKLDRLGINGNEAANGVWLPGSTAPEDASEAYHPRLNNKLYNDTIEIEFRNVTTRGEALDALQKIKNALRNNNFPGVRPRA
jgi:hypothetical protein